MARGGNVTNRLLGSARAAAKARREEARRLLTLGDLSGYGAARRFARRHGVSPFTYPNARDANLDMLPPWVDPRAGLIVDVGANEGNWTADVLRVFPGAEVVAAEPGQEPLATLGSRFAGHRNVSIEPRAVSDATGTSTYYRTRASVFASLLPPEPALHDLYSLPGSPTEVLETVEVETVTLDELIGERPVSVLKLDVQGGELAVLRGGGRVFERTSAVLVEVLFRPHYEGDATFSGVDEALAELGFQLFDLSSPFRLGDGPALWADACYSRSPAA